MIYTLWPYGKQGILSEGDKNAERHSDEKKVRFVEGEKQLLHHDNILAHSFPMIHDFLTKHEMTLNLQSLYLPDLAPSS
jgi:hypothetical protein